jgi:hypothetical protein
MTASIDTKLIIIIVVSSVVGVIAATTVLVIYYLLRSRSEKDVHRETEKEKDMEAQCQVDLRPTAPRPNPASGNFLYTTQEMDSVSTLTQTLALGSNSQPVPMAALDQWVGGKTSKNNARRKSQNRLHSNQNMSVGSDIENDENELRISVNKKDDPINKQRQKEEPRESYLSSGTLSHHYYNQSR